MDWALIIVFLAVVANVVCIVFCAKEIAKDVRRFVRKLKLLRWASKMLELGKEQNSAALKTTVVPFWNHAS